MSIDCAIAAGRSDDKRKFEMYKIAWMCSYLNDQHGAVFNFGQFIHTINELQ
jgi:hypothetical protein